MTRTLFVNYWTEIMASGQTDLSVGEAETHRKTALAIYRQNRRELSRMTLSEFEDAMAAAAAKCRRIL